MEYLENKPSPLSLIFWSIGAAAVRAVEPMSAVILLAAGTLTLNYNFGNKLLAIYTMSGAIMAIILARIYDKSTRKNLYTLSVSMLAVILHILLMISLLNHLPTSIIYLFAALSAAIPAALPGIARVILSATRKDSTILALDAINVEIAWICGPIIAAWADKSKNACLLMAILVIAYLLAAMTLPYFKNSSLIMRPQNPSVMQNTVQSFSRFFSPKILVSLVDSFSIGLIEMAVIISLPLILKNHPHAIGLTGLLVSFLSITGIIGGIVYGKYSPKLRFSINNQTFISLLIISILALMTLVENNLRYITGILGMMGFFITQLNIQRAISLEKSIDPADYAQGSTGQYACFAVGASLASGGMSYLHDYHYLLISAISIGVIAALLIRKIPRLPG